MQPTPDTADTIMRAAGTTAGIIIASTGVVICLLLILMPVFVYLIYDHIKRTNKILLRMEHLLSLRPR